MCEDTGNDGSAGIDPAADPVSVTEEPSRPSVSEGNRLRGQGIVTEEVVEDEEGERDGKKSEGHSHLRAVAGADEGRGGRVSDIEEREGEVFQGDSPAHQGRVLLELPATNGVDSDGNGSPGGRGVEGGEGDAECRGSWRQPLTPHSPRLPALGSAVAMQVEEHRGHRPVLVRGSRGWPLSPGRGEGRSRKEGECAGDETEDEVLKRLECKSANATSS